MAKILSEWPRGLVQGPRPESVRKATAIRRSSTVITKRPRIKRKEDPDRIPTPEELMEELRSLRSYRPPLTREEHTEFLREIWRNKKAVAKALRAALKSGKLKLVYRPPEPPVLP